MSDHEIVGEIGLLDISQPRGVLGDMKIKVKVIGIKSSYGNTRYIVKPIDGSGSAVVSADKLTLRTDS